jgi:hypothetical protein
MARQVALQWRGEIPKPRSLDCSVTPSDSMKWRPPADHGQKHETGDWIHFALDDRRPITEAEPAVTTDVRNDPCDSCVETGSLLSVTCNMDGTAGVTCTAAKPVIATRSICLRQV